MNLGFLLRRFWHYEFTWPVSSLDNFCSMQFGNHLLHNYLCFHREIEGFLLALAGDLDTGVVRHPGVQQCL